MNEILVQAGSYFIVLLLAIIIVSVILRGFFWTYIRVRWFNRDKQKVLVKFRTINIPFYKVGKITERDLLVKVGKTNRRINNIPKTAIYRDLNVNWLEVDDEKNSVIDYTELTTAVEGFDADKMNSLYLRALYKPPIIDNTQMIMLVLLAGILIISLGNVYLNYQGDKNIKLIAQGLNELNGYVRNLTPSI